jgi:uncharacterized damage-inducible protein DinB
MSRLEMVIERIRTARDYTVSLVEATNTNDWFRQPAEGVTHIAWQVGHLAAAEYFLTMSRIRGAGEDDDQLISQDFRKLFGRNSVPDPRPEAYPDPEVIRQVFDRVHPQALDELARLPEKVLDEPVDNPHPMFSTKLGALMFCPFHEMLHAGQIGLLRRLLGETPLR